MGSMVPGAALLAQRCEASLEDAIDEIGEGVLLLDTTFWVSEASRTARRLLEVFGSLGWGCGFDLARAIDAAVANGRVRAEPRLVHAWLAELRAGEPGDIVVETAGGTLLRLAGRILANGQMVVTVSDVTASRRRERWLEAERHHLVSLCDRLREQVTGLQADWIKAEARASAAEARTAELERLAYTDPLTGLLNRRRLTELADAEVARAHRHGRALSLLMMDLDRFKLVNDRFGHAAGDAALRGVADTCLAALRAGDLMARWGGEEFVALLPETTAEGAGRLAERLRREVAAHPARQDGRSIPVTISIGIAELLPGDVSIIPVLARADDALYAAKRAGRNLVLAA